MSLESKELTLQFIEDYREKEVLWNSTKKDYCNKQLRGDALSQLASKYNCQIPNIKNKIKSLRSYFSKEFDKVSKRRSGSGGNDVYVSKWFAFEPLMFLKDVSCPGVTKDSVGEINPTTLEVVLETEDMTDGTEDILSPDSQPSPVIESSTPTPQRRSKKRTNDEKEEHAFKIMNQAFSVMQRKSEYSSFGELIAQKIENLNSERLRKIAQLELLKTITNIELSEENLSAANMVCVPRTTTSSSASSTPHPAVPIISLPQSFSSSPPSSSSSSTIVTIPDHDYVFNM